MKALSFLALIFCFGNAHTAHARDHAGQFSLGLGAGIITEAPWATPPFREAVTLGPKASVFGRWHYLSHHSGLELSYDTFSHGGSNLSSNSLIGSYFYRFDVSGPAHPMVGFGIGHSWTKNYFLSGDYNTAIFKLRIGVEIELHPKWDLSVHLDHYQIFRNFPDEPNLTSLSPTISIVRYFGDYYAPEEFEAAREGKPYPPVSPMPEIPGPVVVASADADGDGVADEADRCSNTPTGAKANKLGCGAEQSFEITPELRFASQKADYPSEGDAALAEVVKILNDHPSLIAEVQGHTDTVGTTQQNDLLSRHRSEVVRERLITHFKVKASRLRAKAYGDRYPIAASNSPAQHARNRRVVIRFSQE
ncbi:MAG: OmpA family protein [Proteobacteria bacterium]|nr:MAG: OmpA family protein [Pseudomonadota bacterium]